jgi:adenylate cyclase
MEKSQLTFIFADLAGFTALTEMHGDDDATEVAARFYDLAHASLCGDARLVKTIGDAVMLVADQIPDAVSTALQLVAAVRAEPGFPVVRIGLHNGPAVERSGDYFGAVVNLAARIAAYARPDQILCTEAIAESVSNLDIAICQPTGVVSFKNIAQPVAIFEIEDRQRTMSAQEIDPVCRMALDPLTACAQLPFEDHLYHFCSFECAQKFVQNPTVYIKPDASN